jgi:hypothetical protein
LVGAVQLNAQCVWWVVACHSCSLLFPILLLRMVLQNVVGLVRWWAAGGREYRSWYRAWRRKGGKWYGRGQPWRTMWYLSWRMTLSERRCGDVRGGDLFAALPHRSLHPLHYTTTPYPYPPTFSRLCVELEFSLMILAVAGMLCTCVGMNSVILLFFQFCS